MYEQDNASGLESAEVWIVTIAYGHSAYHSPEGAQGIRASSISPGTCFLPCECASTSISHSHRTNTPNESTSVFVIEMDAYPYLLTIIYIDGPALGGYR